MSSPGTSPQLSKRENKELYIHQPETEAPLLALEASRFEGRVLQCARAPLSEGPFLQGAEVWYIWRHWDEHMCRLPWHAGQFPKRRPDVCRLGC